MIFAGSGGQGIQFSGKQMAKTGMYVGKNVTFLPSYGPEMRGGTSNCTVVISDTEIGSPSVSNPDVAVVMNKPSFEKFAPKVKAGGKLFVDATLVDLVTDRTDIEVISVPATGMAEENGLSGFSNVILMGKIIKEILDIQAAQTAATAHAFDFDWHYQAGFCSPYAVAKSDLLFKKALKTDVTEEQKFNIEVAELSWRYYKANLFMGEFIFLNPLRMQENEKLYDDFKSHGLNRVSSFALIPENKEDVDFMDRPFNWG